MQKFTNKERKRYNRYVDYHNEGEAKGNGALSVLTAVCIIGGSFTEGIWVQGCFILAVVFGMGLIFSGVHINDPHRDLK